MNEWGLPVEAEVSGQRFAIRSDFRAVLDALNALHAPDLAEWERRFACIKVLYPAWEQLPNVEDAFAAAMEFVNLGRPVPRDQSPKPALVDWGRDVPLIAPAVDKELGYSCRRCEYLHWWEFIGAFNNIGKGVFADVMNIRYKRAHGKKLEPHELAFERENAELIRPKRGMSEEERDYFKRLGVL